MNIRNTPVRSSTPESTVNFFYTDQQFPKISEDTTKFHCYSNASMLFRVSHERWCKVEYSSKYIRNSSQLLCNKN